MRTARVRGEIAELTFSRTRAVLCCVRAGCSRLATAPPTPASAAGGFEDEPPPPVIALRASGCCPNFNPEWVRLGRSAGDSYGPHYTLEISPGGSGRSQYGAYPLRLSWRAGSTYRQVAGQCMLIIKPCVRAAAEPVVRIWPAGQIWLLLENRDSTGIDVSVSIRQCGSDWSKEWEFGLSAKDGPSGFSRSFDPPAGKRHGDYELAVSAAGVPLVRRTVRVRRSRITRRHTSDMQVSA